nr:hybrid sensor histidine kinase/response regulator [Ramlibacter pallidus]
MALDWIRQQQALLQQSLVVRFEKEDLARRLEQQVELVREANREKTRFFASASHDLRQPLHAISLFTSTLQRTALPADGVETVEQLAQSVQALSHSLETMLDVSRLDAGAVQPRLRSVGVHALFVSLQNTFAGRAEEKGLHLRLRSPGDLHVASDPLLLERLVGNLVDNAIKYTHAGGVLVAARAADVSGRAGHIRIDVVDTGQGIPAEEHRRVFEEFYQVGNPQRDRGSGLGIGLSIVKRLSELLAHPVRLQSRPGRGTRVQVWVPQAHAAPSARSEGDAAAETVAAPALPAHVLVLDDEAASRQAMAALLASHGCRVSTAGGIAEAEALLHGARFDAAIVDYRLPGARNGLDYLLDLREQSPRLRTLLVTGETAPRRMAAIHASGVPFLHKPVRAQQLLEALASPREPHGEKT